MLSATVECPYSHDARKSARIAQFGRAVDRRITGFEDGREALRDVSGRQAGFKAELIGRFAAIARPPIIYLHGEAHRATEERHCAFLRAEGRGDPVSRDHGCDRGSARSASAADRRSRP